jgi:peptidoglycan/LPS O-acetylase OafA/YrhL
VTGARSSSASEASAHPDGAVRLSDRLTRKVSSGRYVPEIDGVRFLAIGIVLTVHLFAVAGLASGRLFIVPPFGSIVPGDTQGPRVVSFLQYGHIGVYLFFILSGFVLAVPFIRWRAMHAEPVALPRYLVRRLTRIEPPFVAVVVILFVLSTALHSPTGMPHLAATLTYTHAAIYGQLSPLDGVFWSLEAEVQWYLVVPFLAIVLCRGSHHQRVVRITLAWAGALLLQLVLGVNIVGRVALLDALQFFLIGWFIAEFHVARFKERSLQTPIFDVVGIACIPLLFVALDVRPPLWRVTVPLVGGVVIAAALHGSFIRRCLSMRWIALVGGMCYSIYLIHYPVLVLGAQTFGAHLSTHPLPTPVVVGASLLVAFALSGLFFVLVERPCMDPAWIQRLVSRVKGREPVPRADRRPS